MAGGGGTDIAIDQDQRGQEELSAVSIGTIPDSSFPLDTRSRRVCVGFSPLQEVLFLVALQASRRVRVISAARDLCVCGLPLGKNSVCVVVGRERI